MINVDATRISFKGKIIDSHTHVGHWDKPNNLPYTLADVFQVTNTAKSNGDNVEKIIVSTLECIKTTPDGNPLMNEIKGNLRLLEECANYPKAFPIAVCQPKTGSVKNIINLFKNHPGKFIGLKFHPDNHKLIASDDKYKPYLKFAQEHNLPCVFHCGINLSPGFEDFVEQSKRYSNPEEIYKIARNFPNVPVIMAHMGAGGSKVHEKTVNTLLNAIENGDANLYADISWVNINTFDGNKNDIIYAIKRLKNTSKGDHIERLLFGSDAPIAEYSRDFNTYPKFIREVKNAIKNDSELASEADDIIDKIFYKNANKLFFKNKNLKRQKNTTKTIIEAKDSLKHSKVSNILPFILAGVGILSFILFLINKSPKNLNPVVITKNNASIPLYYSYRNKPYVFEKFNKIP